ncbi:MAG: type II secretion system F family protein, partial [Acidobacteriota bacterium]|nr:type II secretion system F family protein [Acidobacteriota bacterium]
MRFTVKLTTPNGDIQTRDFEAASADEVRSRVISEGGFPIEVARSSSSFRSTKQLKAETLILFNQELLALLRAGIPLLQSLELLKGHGKDPLLRSSLERVVELVKEGMAFSEALEQAGTFPAVYRANVVAGERSGTLPEVVSRWLAFQKFAQVSRRRITEALIYPAFLVVVLLGCLMILFNVVLPRFNEIYSSGGIEMPTATRVLLGIGTFMRSTLWIQGILVVVLVFVVRWMVTTEAGRRANERILLSLPRMGTLYRMY